MSETDDLSETPAAANESSEVAAANAWDPATAEPASATAAWKALELQRDEAKEAYESQIASFKAQSKKRLGPLTIS